MCALTAARERCSTSDVILGFTAPEGRPGSLPNALALFERRHRSVRSIGRATPSSAVPAGELRSPPSRPTRRPPWRRATRCLPSSRAPTAMYDCLTFHAALPSVAPTFALVDADEKSSRTGRSRASPGICCRVASPKRPRCSEACRPAGPGRHLEVSHSRPAPWDWRGVDHAYPDSAGREVHSEPPRELRSGGQSTMDLWTARLAVSATLMRKVAPSLFAKQGSLTVLDVC
jgi:hypothetical protein